MRLELTVRLSLTRIRGAAATMGRWPKLGILLLLITLYFVDQTATATNSTSTTTNHTATNNTVSGPVGEFLFNASDVYEDFTDVYEVSHIGTIDLPPCIKNLMNCWELLNPDVICKYNLTQGWFTQARFDTICMDLRFQCREYTGPTPFPTDRYIDNLLNYCPKSQFLKNINWYRWNGDPYNNDGY